MISASSESSSAGPAIGFYIACTVSDAPIEPAMRASATYNVFLLPGLAVVTSRPQLTLWLPHAIGLH